MLLHHDRPSFILASKATRSSSPHHDDDKLISLNKMHSKNKVLKSFRLCSFILNFDAYYP
jgi:hypothetical protein